MNFTNYKTIDEFKKYVMPHLLRDDEAQMNNNLLLSVAGAIEKGIYKEKALFALGEGQQVKMAAICTPPHNLILSETLPEMVSLFIEGLLEYDYSFPGFIGLQDIAEQFAGTWEQKTNVPSEQVHKMHFYAAAAVKAPPAGALVFRPANEDDLPLLTQWEYQFAVDARLPEHEQVIDEARTLRKIKNDQLYLLTTKNGSPLSMSGFVPVAANGVRIGSVYTPRESRGQGYAGICTGALCQHLLSRDITWCSLFADTQNPASNAIYRKLGFKERAVYTAFALKKTH
jgi:predicted GNAT family acetyltransferase